MFDDIKYKVYEQHFNKSMSIYDVESPKIQGENSKF